VAALLLAACASPDPPRPPLERATPLPRPATPEPLASRSPRPPLTPTPTVAPSLAPLPDPTATPTPAPRASAPSGYWRLDAAFSFNGSARVRESVTAGPTPAAPAFVGTTDGQGFARLILARRPLPAVLALAVAGRAVGDLYLAEGQPPRLNPQPGWAVRLGGRLDEL